MSGSGGNEKKRPRKVVVDSPFQEEFVPFSAERESKLLAFFEASRGRGLLVGVNAVARSLPSLCAVAVSEATSAPALTRHLRESCALHGCRWAGLACSSAEAGRRLGVKRALAVGVPRALEAEMVAATGEGGAGEVPKMEWMMARRGEAAYRPLKTAETTSKASVAVLKERTRRKAAIMEKQNAKKVKRDAEKKEEDKKKKQQQQQQQKTKGEKEQKKGSYKRGNNNNNNNNNNNSGQRSK